jgi:hypothetical protein
MSSPEESEETFNALMDCLVRTRDAARVVVDDDRDALQEELGPNLGACACSAASALALHTLAPESAFRCLVDAHAATSVTERTQRARLAAVVRSAIPAPTRAQLEALLRL